ncbi:MAG: hypothetical protein IT269_12025 [Saprospiraceae bacterium]|nr:hypothetical protein [Saprospiraceae bacterium]
MNTLLTILRALDKEQMRALHKFVRSPYHVTHSDVILLFDWLRGHLESSPDDIPDWPDFERLLPPSKKRNDRRLYDLGHYLLGVVESFLAHEKKRDDTGHYLATTAALREMKLENEAASMLKYTSKRIHGNRLRGQAFLSALAAIEQETWQISLQQGRARATNVQALSDTQDAAFIVEKLRTGCLLLSHETVANTTYDRGLLPAVLDFLKGHRLLEQPIIAAYYHGYYAMSGEDDAADHFSLLKQVLEHHGSSFALDETHDLYLIAINFCIRRINRNDQPFFRQIFELYRSGLEQGALLEGGQLSRWTYNNIVSTALHQREYEWLRHFLEDFAPLLPEIHREGALNFGLARYYYETRQHRLAMQHLLRMEYDDVLQNLMAKVLLAKIYHELNESDSLDNQLDSIQIYLRRKQVLGYHKDNYTAIVRFMRRLVNLNFTSKSDVLAFRKDIESAPVLTEREWLLRQIQMS